MAWIASVKIVFATNGSVILAGSPAARQLSAHCCVDDTARRSADGLTLLAGTYFGGAQSISPSYRPAALGTDNSGNIYLARIANSDSFHITPGAYRRDHIPPCPTDWREQ